jgi:hypothetical protein
VTDISGVLTTSIALMMEAVRIFEISVYFYQTKWRNAPDDISFPLDASKPFAPVTWRIIINLQ